ncbi:Venom dipeptidyl peptidase 4 [Folsomia candida]|uniref:Venom dipeptidyl peptidase 4 n=1 Tax=Folsomia candida TaxID=158441 RepID=A0A226DMQ8_FOLCA|nr:Venom dipeptidyl peptidase 4 [Folsomia candida]
MGSRFLDYRAIFEDMNSKLWADVVVTFEIVCAKFGANWIMRSQVIHRKCTEVRWPCGFSSSLAFVRFDDSGVDFYQWPLYGEPGVRDTVYPVYEPLRYPKAGRDNPIVSLHILKLDDPTAIRQVVYPPGQDVELQYYIATITWATADQVIIQNLNRNQDKTVWNLCSAASGICSEVLERWATTPVGWWDPHRPLVSRDGSKFLTFVNAQQSTDPNKRLYRHVVSINSVPPNPELQPLTEGAFHVDAILGWDVDNNKLYVSGTGFHPETSPLGDPSERHVYSIATTGPNSPPECISCTVLTSTNEECRSHSVSFSANFKFYMHTCRGPGVPEVTTRFTSNNSIASVWNDNALVRERLATKLLPSLREMEVDLPLSYKAKVRLYCGRWSSRGRLDGSCGERRYVLVDAGTPSARILGQKTFPHYLPPNFDESKQYPLLVEVYAGPDSQKITQDYGINWGSYLASSKEVIFANIDGRGSARQSAEQKFAVYRNLGSVEVEDQISALGKDNENVFKCGISGAPVSSWLYYDTIYTERYMGLPTVEDNWEGYNQSSVMANMAGIANKEFLLIHGNADDNVHYQNSMMLARALEQADILFTALSYPEENHRVNGPGMQRHLYHSCKHFLTRNACFGPLGNP